MNDPKLDEILMLFMAKINQLYENDEIEVLDEQEAVYFWLALGRFLGIDALLPNMKLIVSNDINDLKRVVAFVASPSSDIVKKMSDEKVLTDLDIEKALFDLENRKGH